MLIAKQAKPGHRATQEFVTELDALVDNTDKNNQLVMVAFEVAEGQGDAVIHAIHSMRSLVPEIQKEREQAKMKQIVDALLPDMALPRHRVLEARMLADAKRTILESGDWITASDISKMAGFSDSNPSTQPNRWKKAGAIFAIDHKNIDYYPIFALEINPKVRPHPAIKEIVSILNRDGWGLAFWFTSMCSYLGGRRPQDVLATDPDSVIAAAKDEAAGVVHG